ncbi:hypothetical protein SFC50_25680 [Bacillus infantis]|uniref:hypothetical protein n=1 Tax=Bacillus infantis TaxID=324767 RepID=UPI0039827024
MKDFEMKHDVSKKSLANLEKVMFAQDDFGVKKYGVPLQHTHNYNWLQMFMEEMADGLKYIQCEIDRKEEIKQILRTGHQSDNPKEYIELVLDILSVEGTGK